MDPVQTEVRVLIGPQIDHEAAGPRPLGAEDEAVELGGGRAFVQADRTQMAYEAFVGSDDEDDVLDGQDGDDVAESGKREACISLGSRNVVRKISIEKDEIADKVDACFKEMKKIAFKHLREKGDVQADSKANFKMQFDHRRSVIRWWVSPDDPLDEVTVRGCYDYKNHFLDDSAADDTLQNEKARIDHLAFDIVNATDEITGFNASQVDSTVSGYLGPIGSSNLSRYFVASDWSSFNGGLHNKKGSESEKRVKAFMDYMNKEYWISFGKEGERDSREVCKDLASSLVYQKRMMDFLNHIKPQFAQSYSTKLQENGGVENAITKRLKTAHSHIARWERQFTDMHMGPLFISKTYEAPEGGTLMQGANKLKKSIHEHLAKVGFDKRGRTEKVKEKFKYSTYKEQTGFEELAVRLAAKETFISRDDYINFSHQFSQYGDQSLGLEEIFFDKMIGLDSGDQPADGYNLPMFNDMDVELQQMLYKHLDQVRVVVRKMRAKIDEETAGDDAKVNQINVTKTALEEALKEEEKPAASEPTVPETLDAEDTEDA